MADDEDADRDLARLVVLCVGRLEETGDPWEPYRLLDADGSVVVPAAEFLAELQARDKSVSTLRSYGNDLLLWWRWLAAVGVPWDRVTTAEGRVILSPQRTVLHVQQRHLSRCSLPGGHGYLSLHPARR